MKRLLQLPLIVGLLLTSFFGQAQEPNHSVVKLAPLHFLHPFEPGMEAALEFVRNDRWSFQANAGVIMRVFANPYITSQFGFSGAGEGRWYYSFPSDEKIDRRFLGVALGYSQYTAEMTELFTHKEEIDENTSFSFTYQDEFSYYKQVYSLTARAGRVYIVNNFKFELSMGLAIQLRSGEYDDRLYPNDPVSREFARNTLLTGTATGTYFSYRAPIQFRIGYMF